MTNPQNSGLARGLVQYGDADFSLYLRRSFAKQAGYSNEQGCDFDCLPAASR